MKWYVQIEAEKFVLQELSKSLKSPRLSVFQREANYYLSCDLFDSLDDPEHVFEKAKILGPVLSGATRLELGKPLRLGNVFRENEDGSWNEFGFAEVSALIPKLFCQAAGEAVQAPSLADNVKVWLQAARRNGEVDEALSLFGSPDLSWVLLYKVFEIVEADIKRKIYKTRWVTKTLEDRFTQTAQAHRHAKQSEKMRKYKPHCKPMLFHEGTTFIRTILDNWLRTKQEVQEGT
jgi:hypothetical protein